MSSGAPHMEKRALCKLEKGHFTYKFVKFVQVYTSLSIFQSFIGNCRLVLDTS